MIDGPDQFLPLKNKKKIKTTQTAKITSCCKKQKSKEKKVGLLSPCR